MSQPTSPRSAANSVGSRPKSARGPRRLDPAARAAAKAKLGAGARQRAPRKMPTEELRWDASTGCADLDGMLLDCDQARWRDPRFKLASPQKARPKSASAVRPRSAPPAPFRARPQLPREGLVDPLSPGALPER